METRTDLSLEPLQTPVEEYNSSDWYVGNYLNEYFVNVSTTDDLQVKGDNANF